MLAFSLALVSAKSIAVYLRNLSFCVATRSIFAKTFARLKIIVTTLFLSPSFLYLCRFPGIFVRRIFVQDSLGRVWLRVAHTRNCEKIDYNYVRSLWRRFSL